MFDSTHSPIDYHAPKSAEQLVSLERAYRSYVTIAADSVPQLRACDVYRVVDTANNDGVMYLFADWLLAERPDLAAKIAEATADIQEV